MNIIVVGQGAMGLLWYHHLAISTVATNLSLLASTQHNLADDNYHFIDSHGIPYQGKINYAYDEQIKNADVILLCVKSFQIGSTLKQIAQHSKANTSIILAHNGMGTLTELPKELINKYNIYALLTTHGCLRKSSLNITHTGIGITDIGLVSGCVELTEQQALTYQLNQALPSVNLHKNIIEKQWQKLAVNCVINPITALHDIDNGQVNNTIFTGQIEKVLTELVLVAKSEGIYLNIALLIKTVRQVAAATAKNCSSMRCDVLAHKQTEINYINGYIHKLGIKHKIATPENTQLWQTVLRQVSFDKLRTNGEYKGKRRV
ncbi:ketopantoate reductase family protein [Candidatus Colwellia aromaticivorans]|uniref:ketopantoate reductase family protein n=1 Tax=Candidatus Colwellia aromaticivorans TaxID=2267621 RepID=UPI000DF18F44|nr:2-dehydropantoate 2-reductase [Candidatus Colwellia aromaticivorans]